VETVAFTFSHLGETSSLERDRLSLKTGARRERQLAQDPGSNIWYSRLGETRSFGENTRFLHCSRMQNTETIPKSQFNQWQATITASIPHEYGLHLENMEKS